VLRNLRWFLAGTEIVQAHGREVRQALRLADAMAPCVLLRDEIEQRLAGATGSGQIDSRELR
jgi:hypothetical protein